MLVLVARLTRLPELLWRLVASPDTMPRKRNTKGANRAAAKKKNVPAKNAGSRIATRASQQKKTPTQSKKSQENPTKTPVEKPTKTQAQSPAKTPPATPKNAQRQPEQNKSAPSTPKKTKEPTPTGNASPPANKSQKEKKPISNQPRANAPVRNMRPRHAKLKIGGVQNCTRCKQICSYGHQCPSCKRTFHNFCMLSLHKSTSKMCIACFEKSNASLKVLDSHLHDPYSPGKFIPYHPFTKHYATARSIQLHTKVCLPHIFSWGVCL